MIAMRPILEPDVLELLNDGRFDGDIEGYVVMDGPNYLGHMLYRIDGDFVDVLDCGLQESALVDGGVREAARLAASYADATTAKVAVVTGKAVGPAWVALCNADLTIAVEGCTIAPLAPQAAVSVLYKEELDASGNIVAATQKKAAQWAAETCSAAAALQAGLADFAVPAADARAALVGALDMLSTKRTQRLPKKHGNMAL